METAQSSPTALLPKLLTHRGKLTLQRVRCKGLQSKKEGSPQAFFDIHQASFPNNMPTLPIIQFGICVRYNGRVTPGHRCAELVRLRPSHPAPAQTAPGGRPSPDRETTAPRRPGPRPPRLAAPPAAPPTAQAPTGKPCRRP